MVLTVVEGKMVTCRVSAKLLNLTKIRMVQTSNLTKLQIQQTKVQILLALLLESTLQVEIQLGYQVNKRES